MLNWVFLGLVLIGTLTGAFSGKMADVSKSMIDSSKTAVDLALGLVGQMALWLGVMKVLEDVGFLPRLAKLMRPVMARLFPYVPADHPAMGAMILNLAANMLGLTNAATPFGIKAMIELNKLNDRPGVATNAMVLFLAINTSGVAVLPTGVVAVRASMGAKDPTAIFLPTLLATSCSTIIAIIAVKLLERLKVFGAERYPVDPTAATTSEVKGLSEAQAMAVASRPFTQPYATIALVIGLALLAGLLNDTGRIAAAAGLPAELGFLARLGNFEVLKQLSADWILPLLMVTILLLGLSVGGKVYDSVVKGAKEGFNVAITIIPFLVAILVAIGMFRSSGAMAAIVDAVTPVADAIGFPAKALPMALIRPLSGSGAMAVLMETLKTEGPDSFISFVVSVMNGSFETTFYVLAVYFGAVGVRATRHTILGCLASDLAGITGAVVFSRLFYG